MVTKPEEQLLSGASRFLRVDPFSRFARVLRSRVASRAGTVQHGLVPGRFPKTRERRPPRIRGASRRGHHDGRDAGHGVPPPGARAAAPEPVSWSGADGQRPIIRVLTDIQILRTFGGYFAQDGTSFLCRQAKIYVTQLQH